MVDLTRLGYREIAERYDLGTVKFGGDLQLTETGDLKTLNGDLQLGDVTHNALHRFVVSWQFNAPMLKTLFDFVDSSAQRQKEHADELEQVAVAMADARSGVARGTATDRWHELHQEIGIDEIGPRACAGTIMVVLTSLLRLEWTNLGKPNRWDTAADFAAGFSFGQIVEAAANNFRHVDEWLLTSQPTEQQLRSMRPLVAVTATGWPTPGNHYAFWRNACPEVLARISGGSFEGLMDATFAFVRALADVK